MAATWIDLHISASLLLCFVGLCIFFIAVSFDSVCVHYWRHLWQLNVWASIRRRSKLFHEQPALALPALSFFAYHLTLILVIFCSILVFVLEFCACVSVVGCLLRLGGSVISPVKHWGFPCLTSVNLLLFFDAATVAKWSCFRTLCAVSVIVVLFLLIFNSSEASVQLLQ